MDNSYSPDLITLLDEDNQERNFEILDVVSENDKQYYALMPVYEDKTDMLYDSGEYIILESVEENGEQLMLEVEDRELRARLSEIFEERFNEMFYEN